MKSYLIYLLPFFLTVVIESLTNKIILRDRTVRVILYTFLINLFSWPIANIFFGIGLNFFVVELAVILVEVILIKFLFKKTFLKSSFASFVANLITSLVTYISL